MHNPFGWIEIYVGDMNRAQSFYETVFQVKLENMAMPEGIDSGMQMLTFPSNMGGWGCSGALVKAKEVSPGTGGTIAYFTCDDCSVEIARVAAAGGTVAQEKMSIGEYGFIAIAIDTEGNTIGFHSMK
ncbi:MAG: VOC family protein [Candidatus Absconditabacterales bacterium]